MTRKSFEYKSLKFFERDKDDVDFAGIGERYKADNFRFIQANTKKADDILALLGMEMHKEYTAKELTLYMYGDAKEIKMCLWHSYKFNDNPNRESMLKVIEGEEKKVLALLLNLENPPVKKKANQQNLSSNYTDALLLATYGMKPEELGKMPQRIYSDLLEKIPAVITYQQTGEIMDGDNRKKKDVENVAWAREQGLLN